MTDYNDNYEDDEDEDKKANISDLPNPQPNATTPPPTPRTGPTSLQQASFAPPQQQEPGLEQPAIDPIDVLAGAAAAKLAPMAVRGVMSAGESLLPSVERLSGNTVGAVGADLKDLILKNKAKQLASGEISQPEYDKVVNYFNKAEISNEPTLATRTNVKTAPNVEAMPQQAANTKLELAQRYAKDTASAKKDALKRFR